MSKDNSATVSQKTTPAPGATPFDEILVCENREKQRVQTEKDAMQLEEADIKQSLSKKEADSEQKMKEDAKKELSEMRSKELSAILKNAEKSAEKKVRELEETYNSKSKPVIEKLAKQFFESDSMISE